MNRHFRLLGVGLLALFQPQWASAASSFTSSSRPTTAAEIADDPSLAGYTVWEFFVTSDSDILLFDHVSVVGGPVYQNPLVSDRSPASPILVSLHPATGADSYITTPGDTSIAYVPGGSGFDDIGAAWFDVTSDGPQVNFKFAQFTVPSELSTAGEFSGRLQRKNPGFPIVEPFSLSFGFLESQVVPEPCALALTGVCLIAFVASRRRQS